MACNTITKITKTCSNNAGGIYKLYIQDVDNVTFSADTSGHTLTSLSGSPKFISYEFSRNVGSVSSEPKIDLINGSTYFETTITLKFSRREAAKSRSLQILGEGQRYLDIIYSDANGINWLVDYAQLSGGAETTGMAKGDGSNYEVTFVAQMNNRQYTVSDALLSANI